MSSEELLKKQIIEKAWEDASFKQRLLSDPKAALREAFGVNVPDHIELKAVEESPTEFYVVIPPNPSESQDDDGAGTNGAW
ncbi:NHLP leader peptide family RiPP precursor [Paenibacillus oceani]|uniref:NHLP leader peptide family natural product n=1 Tax=Paenibacillus oceani TaxID=2772510 RepID=A0A927GZ40_9BACL|nr:NHLP leader peptide family RiPP precursor [Paenibacillus oceani]MBD2861079.1 NHLP leader peptide family natural product precursor [Paenibacillus oceani]